MASTKQMPVLSKTLDLKYLSHKKKASLKWGSINAVLFGVLIYDLKYKCQYYTTWLHYVEYCLIIVFGLNAIYHCLRYLYHTFIMSPVLVTARQKSLLGFKDHDNSYRIQSPSSFRPVPQDSSPPAPINLSTRSWLSNSTVNESLNQSSASPSWVYSRGSPSMPNYKPQQLSFNEMPDSVVNEQTFREYLRNAEEMEKNDSIINSSAAGDSPKERSIFWNHPSTRTGNELSPVFKKNQYQLAPLNSEIPHASGVNEEGSPKSPQISSLNIWTNQQIDPLLLTQWNANIRNWISTTILARVVKEIKEIDGALLKLGLTDVRIGHVGLDRLKKTAQTLQIMHHVPTLSILMPFMELSNNQEYLVQRIKELSSGGCMSDFKWNGGGNLHGKSWDETLPTDSAIIMHFVATYLDTQLLPVSQNSYPEDPPFTTQHLCKVPDKPRRGPDALIIHQTSLSPPHYVLIIGEETREIPKGRNNLIHTLLLFLHTVAVKHHGMLGRVNLGKSGVNVLWVVDQ